MIWSLHIPKTAGTTFRSVLQLAFAERVICAYGEGHPYDTSYASGYIFDRRIGAAEFMRRCVDENIQCVHGHFEARSVLGTFAHERFIVWIRDPVERILSEYFHHRRERDPLNHFSVLIHDGQMTINEFADAEENQNVQSKYVAGINPGQLAFVGITEQFDVDIAAFWTQFAGQQPLTYTRLNVNPQREAATCAADPAVREHLVECNRDDIAMYRHYLNRHRQ